MILPFALIVLATSAAAVLAYGTNPDLARWESGIAFIMHVRRLQGPLVMLSLLPCVLLIVLVIINKRRAWWLIGLAPVLALFAHRFALSDQKFFSVVDVTSDQFLRADEVSFLKEDEWVVGLVCDDQAYAYPYSALYSTPVVVHTDRARRWVLVWSPFANYASAWVVDRTLRGRDLEIVSMPANATLVYNSRLGEFINGITGLNQNQQTPPELHDALRTMRTTYGQWKKLHADTRVMPPFGPIASQLPPAPVRPLYAIPPGYEPRERAVAVVRTPHPLALAMDEITSIPANLTVGTNSLLVFADPRSGEIRAFDRRMDDLSPRFRLNDQSNRRAWLIDIDTNSGWDARGVAVDGPLAQAKTRLRELEIQPNLYWGIMKFWMPGLEMAHPLR